jgi:metallo-beta-lactamase family protein
MAGSGMCTAGRIVHHLRHNLARENVAVVIVGYQAEGSLGRRLVDGAKTVKIFGEEIVVRARVHTLNGFSAHAGQSDLARWFEPLADDRPRLFLTHGEERGRDALAALLASRFGLAAEKPMLRDTVEL